jgi:DNA repair ATPase RecN
VKKSTASNNRLLIIAILITVHCSLLTIYSQDEPPTDLVIAPEISLSESESKILNPEKNIKKRTQLSIETMEIRLKSAESFNQTPKFKEALAELGSYQALLEDSYKFLEMNNLKSDKVQNNFKKLELILKKHTSRLEIIRREMPYKFGWHVGKLMKLVREIRTKAIEPLFGEIN